jgi:hypothetical protein
MRRSLRAWRRDRPVQRAGERLYIRRVLDAEAERDLGAGGVE